MATAKFTGLYYDSKHPELLNLLGLTDPNGDGAVNSKEGDDGSNPGFVDFFATLTAAERTLLNSFDSQHPLRVVNFRNNPHLARVALKRIVYDGERENITEPGFPTTEELAQHLDFSLADVARPLIETVIFDWGDWYEGLSKKQWRRLTGSGEEETEVLPLLAVLRRIEDEHDIVKNTSEVSFQYWKETCDALAREGTPVDAWETWAQLTTVWLASSPWWDGPVQHGIFHASMKLGGLMWRQATGLYSGIGPTLPAENGERLPTIGSKAISNYLADPSAYALPATAQPTASYDSALRSLRLEAKSVWPDHPTSVTLWEWVHGVAGARLEADPKATVTSWQVVEDSELKFLPGQPLVKLNGFHFQLIDESELVADIHDKLWAAFVEEYPVFGYDIKTGTFLDDLPRDFDFEGISPTGISILNGRLCLTLTGEANTRDLIKPCSDDVVALDISLPLTRLLGGSAQYGPLLAAFFDNEGNVFPNVPLDILQEAIQDALEGKSKSPQPRPGGKNIPVPGAERVISTVRADDIEVDLSSLILDADKALDKFGIDAAVTALAVTNGRISTQYRYDSTLSQASGDWFTEGMADVELGLSMPGVSSAGSELFVGKLYFHYDALVNRGYAKLVLPDVTLRGISAQVDGSYDGSVTVGLEFQGGVPGPGGYSAENLFKTIAVDAVLSINKDHGDFLAAAVKIRDERQDEMGVRVHQLMIDNNIALHDGSTELYGILNDGTFTRVQAFDENNRYLMDEFSLLASHVVVGGLGNFFGDGVAVEVRRGDDGSYIVRPKLKAGNLENKYEVDLGNVGGELVITPIKSAVGVLEHFRIEAKNLSISVSDASLDMKDKHIRGRTDAVLSGTWESEAPNLVELLANGRDWKGRGSLKMTRTDNNLTVTDDDGQKFAFNSDRIDTEFIIGTIEFNPFRGSGKLTETMHHGNIAYENRQFTITSDLSGWVTVSGKYPLVRMQVLQLIADGAQNAPQEVVPEVEKTRSAREIVFGPEIPEGDGDANEVFPDVTPEQFAAAEAQLILEGIQGAALFDEGKRHSVATTFFETTPRQLFPDVMRIVIDDLRAKGVVTDADGADFLTDVAPVDFVDTLAMLVLSCPGGMAVILKAFPDMSREDYIQAMIAPSVKAMHESSLLTVDPEFFASQEFPLEALLLSLDDVRVHLESLPVATGLHYQEAAFGGNWSRYPVVKRGLLRFVNPSIQEGTAFSSHHPDIPFDETLSPVWDVERNESLPGIAGGALVFYSWHGKDMSRKIRFDPEISEFVPVGKAPKPLSEEDVIGFMRMRIPGFDGFDEKQQWAIYEYVMRQGGHTHLERINSLFRGLELPEDLGAQQIFTDGRLQSFRFDLTRPKEKKCENSEGALPPGEVCEDVNEEATANAAVTAVMTEDEVREPAFISFLGFHFTGFGAEEKLCRNGESAMHFYAYTRHGKIDLVGLLRLLYPFKIAKIYSGLKKAGIDVGRGGVPEKREDFGVFLREIEKVFRVEQLVSEGEAALRDSFGEKEFKKLDKTELAGVWDKIFIAWRGRQGPVTKNGEELATYLNRMTADPRFEDHFLEDMDLFDPKLRGQAYVYLEEIQRLRTQRTGEALSKAEKVEIRGYRHLILRLLLKQYLPHEEIIDFDAAVGSIQAYGTPQKADYKWFEIEENGSGPVTAGISFRDGRFHISAATGDGEKLENVTLGLLAPEFKIAGRRLNSVEDLQMDVGPPSENGITKVAVSYGEYDVSDIDLVVMSKQGGGDPTFGILPPYGRKKDFNRAQGSGMTMSTELDKRVTLDLHIRKFESFGPQGTRLFISAPIYTRVAETKEVDGVTVTEERYVLVDFVKVLADLDDVALNDVTVKLRPNYDASRPHQINTVSIDGAIDSNGGINALVFIGKDADGTPRYAEVTDVNAASLLKVEDQDVTISGFARIGVTPPASLLEDPSFDKLRAAGIDIRIDRAIFDGTFNIAVNGGGKGEEPVSIDLTRLGEESPGFVPSSLTVYGEFTFDIQGVSVMVTELRVPIDQFAIELMAKDPKIADSVTRAIVKRFSIPSGSLAVSGAPQGPHDENQLKALEDIEDLVRYVRLYKEEAGRLPTNKQGLSIFDSGTLPKDPWGRDYLYRTPGKNGAEFEIYSRGPDDKKREDDLGSWLIDENAVTSTASGHVDIPPQFGINDVSLKDASLRIAFPEGAAFSMDAEGQPSFSAPSGGRAHVEDPLARNVFDMTTGEITYDDGTGIIRKLTVTAMALDLLTDTVLTAGFQGELRVDVK